MSFQKMMELATKLLVWIHRVLVPKSESTVVTRLRDPKDYTRSISGFSDKQILEAEYMYEAIFVGDFPLPAEGGGWVNWPAAVFWQEEIPERYKGVPGASVYFALFLKADGTSWVTSAKFIEDLVFAGMKSPNGEIIYSRYSHDFRGFTDGTEGWVDGGLDYLRYSDSGGKIVKLRVEKDKIIEVA